MFDANMLVSGSIVEFGDQAHLYYHGAPVIWRPWPRVPKGLPRNLRASTIYPTFMGLATVPRDRFGFATPVVGKAARLTTFPIELSAGKSLWVNAEATPSDLLLTLLAQDGRAVTEGRIGAERRMTVYRDVQWKDTVQPGQYRVRAELRGKARLYSIAKL